MSDEFFKGVMVDVFGDRNTEGLYHVETREEFDGHVAKL